jgi:WD40 repeat protein
MAYDAFISYSHAADGRLAPALQRAMQRLAKPWYRPRALRVFRDESALSANPHLWSSIQTALDEAEWFVLLASPDAVRSEWVNRELAYWLERKPVDRILPVVTDGTWGWAAGELAGTAVLPALKCAFGDEPRHLDLRWARSETDLDTHNARFRDAVAQLAAPIHGVAKDELESEDVRQHRHARRLARGGVSVLALLVLVALVTSGYAVLQRNDARHQRNEARLQTQIANAGRLSALATARASTQLDESLLLAIEGNRMADTAETRSGLVAVLARSPALLTMQHPWSGRIAAASASADGSRFATLTRPGALRVFETASGHQLAEADLSATTSVDAIALSPNGRVLVAAARHPGNSIVDLRAVDASTGRVTATAIDHDFGPLVSSLAISPDGATLVATVPGGVLQRFRLPTLTKIGELISPPEGGFPDGVAFTSDSRAIVVPEQRGTWFIDAVTGLVKTVIPGVRPAKTVAAVTNNGRTLAVGDESGGIEVYDIASRARVATLFLNGTFIDSLRFNADGTQLISGDANGSVVVWNVAKHQPAHPAFTGHSGAAFAAWFDANVAKSVGPSETATWSLAPSAPLGDAQVGPKPYDNLETGNDVARIDDETVAITDNDGVLWQRDVRTGRLVAVALRSGHNYSGNVLVSRDGTLILQGVSNADPRPGADNVDAGYFVLWDRATRRKLTDTPAPMPGWYDLALSPDGTRLADGVSGHATILDVRTGKRLYPPLGPNTYNTILELVAWSRDGSTIATAGSEGAIDTWNAATGRHLRTFANEGTEIRALAMSDDGSRVATATKEGLVHIVDTQSGQSAVTSFVVNGRPTKIAFSESGDLVAVGTADGAVTIWDLRSQSVLGSALQPHSAQVNGIAFADHDRVLVTGSSDGTVAFESLDPAVWRARACAIVGRNLSQAEWRQYVGGPYHRTCPQWPAGS